MSIVTEDASSAAKPSTPWASKPNGERLLSALAELLDNQRAIHSFLRGPLYSASAADFPEPYEETLVGVGQLVTRLLHYCQLGHLRPTLIDRRQPLEFSDRSLPPQIGLEEIDDEKVVFVVERLGDARAVIGELCFACAQAYVIAQRPKHPYRGNERAADSIEAEALRYDIAAIVLGLGPIAVNAASDFSQSHELVGHVTITHRQHQVSSSLPAGDLTFLQAIQLALRSDDRSARVLRQLNANQAQDVKRWLAVFDGARAQLMERLGIGPEDLPSDIGPLIVPPIDEAWVESWREQDREHRTPYRDRVSTRHYQTKAIGYAAIGALLSIAPAIFLLADRHTRWLAGLLLVVAGGIGALIGHRRRLNYCGLCAMVVGDDDPRCPKCGARLEGARPYDPDAWEHEALSAEDVIAEAELTRQALAVVQIDRPGERSP